MQRVEPEQKDRQQEANRGGDGQEQAEAQLDRRRLNLQQRIVAEGRHHYPENGRDQQPTQGDKEADHPKVHAGALVAGLDLVLIDHLGHDHIADQHQPAQPDANNNGRGICEDDVGRKAHRDDAEDHDCIGDHQRSAAVQLVGHPVAPWVERQHGHQEGDAQG